MRILRSCMCAIFGHNPMPHRLADKGIGYSSPSCTAVGVGVPKDHLIALSAGGLGKNPHVTITVCERCNCVYAEVVAPEDCRAREAQEVMLRAAQ